MSACVCAFANFFFKKNSPQKLLTGLLPNFMVVFLRWRLKSSLYHNRTIRPVEQYRHSSASSFKGRCHDVNIIYSAMYDIMKSYLTHVRDKKICNGYITSETRIVM